MVIHSAPDPWPQTESKVLESPIQQSKIDSIYSPNGWHKMFYNGNGVMTSHSLWSLPTLNVRIRSLWKTKRFPQHGRTFTPPKLSFVSSLLTNLAGVGNQAISLDAHYWKAMLHSRWVILCMFAFNWYVSGLGDHTSEPWKCCYWCWFFPIQYFYHWMLDLYLCWMLMLVMNFYGASFGFGCLHF